MFDKDEARKKFFETSELAYKFYKDRPYNYIPHPPPKKNKYSKTYEAILKWRKRNPLKIIAHRKVFIAIRNGTLKRQNCFCGNPKAEAHHPDYTKPLEVVWLCKKHHEEKHNTKEKNVNRENN